MKNLLSFLAERMDLMNRRPTQACDGIARSCRGAINTQTVDATHGRLAGF
jgi:hypothetical protein